jgi:SPP1 family holin
MKISKGTIVRTILLLFVLVNWILKKCGIEVIPVSENVVLEFVETAIEIAIIAVNFWKNNSFTEAAIKADAFLKQLRESE